MELNDTPTQAEATPPKRSPERITFQNNREIRRAMIAVQAIMKNRHWEPERCETGCRMAAEADSDEILVFATDGNRACRIQVNAKRERPDQTFSEAIPIDAVRSIAKGKAHTLILKASKDYVELSDDDSGPWTMHLNGVVWQRPTFDRILNTDTEGGPIGENIPRRAMLRALRAMPKQSQPLCRLSIGPDGIKAWATDSKHVGDNYAPDATLSGRVTGSGTTTVLAISRKDLTDTVRTMTRHEVRIKVRRWDTPISVSSMDERERFILATKRMN